MSDLLDRIQSEIRARLDANRDAVREYERLEAALAALDASNSTDSTSGGSAKSRARTPASARPQRTSTRRRKRAPRGANRSAVLRIVGERPGITTSELAAASDIEKRTLYTLLSTLTKQGALDRQELPGGQTGYRLADADVGVA